MRLNIKMEPFLSVTHCFNTSTIQHKIRPLCFVRLHCVDLAVSANIMTSIHNSPPARARINPKQHHAWRWIMIRFNTKPQSEQYRNSHNHGTVTMVMSFPLMVNIILYWRIPTPPSLVWHHHVVSYATREIFDSFGNQYQEPQGIIPKYAREIRNIYITNNGSLCFHNWKYLDSTLAHEGMDTWSRKK